MPGPPKPRSRSSSRSGRGGSAHALLAAFEAVPRAPFVAPRLSDLALRDIGLPLGCGQMMAAPSALAAMIGALDLHPGHRVLEIGTGSGFAAAVLARLGAEVVTVERLPLARGRGARAAGRDGGRGHPRPPRGRARRRAGRRALRPHPRPRRVRRTPGRAPRPARARGVPRRGAARSSGIVSSRACGPAMRRVSRASRRSACPRSRPTARRCCES